MPKNDLLPCPFCGRKPKSIVNIQMYAIGCSFSKCHVYPCVVKKTPEEAAKAWNIRASGWISVEEALPEIGYSVLVTRQTESNTRYIRIASRQDNCWMDNTDKYGKPNQNPVIAWMPLPDPPKTQ